MKKVKINFQKEYKLYNACAKKDEFRPAMAMVHFKGDCAYASDAIILARVPLSVCTTLDPDVYQLLNGFSIDGKVLKFIYNFDEIFVVKDEEKDTCYVKATMCGSELQIQLQRTGDVGAPNFDRVLSESAHSESVQRIGFSAGNLARLASALGTDIAEMQFSSQKTPMRIETEEGAVGIIMPIVDYVD